MNIETIREFVYEMSTAWGTNSITPADDVLFDDLGLDSLDKIEMVMEVENRFNIDLTNEAVEALKTLGDMIHLIENHKQEAV